MTEDTHDLRREALHRRTSQAPSGAPASASPDWLLIGTVVGVFGVRGELKVRPETDFPARFASTPTVYMGAERAPFDVTGARLTRDHVTLQLRGISDASAAETLRGMPLYVPSSQAVSLPPDQFYLHDVIGLRAERPDGTPLGTISDVYTAPANDIFVVRDGQTGREVLVPAVKDMIKRVDLAGGVVVVDPIPGLFDADFETGS